MKPHLIGHEPVAGEPGPVQRILTFLDPLLRCPPPVVEVHYALGFGGLLLFALIAFVLTAIVQLIHDIDNPFEYGKNTVADVDTSVLFKLEKFWKTGQIKPNLK